jgi:hypothetical protein
MELALKSDNFFIFYPLNDTKILELLIFQSILLEININFSSI